MMGSPRSPNRSRQETVSGIEMARLFIGGWPNREEIDAVLQDLSESSEHNHALLKEVQTVCRDADKAKAEAEQATADAARRVQEAIAAEARQKQEADAATARFAREKAAFHEESADFEAKMKEARAAVDADLSDVSAREATLKQKASKLEQDQKALKTAQEALEKDRLHLSGISGRLTSVLSELK